MFINWNCSAATHDPADYSLFQKSPKLLFLQYTIFSSLFLSAQDE